MKNITFSLFVTIIVSIACKTEQIITTAQKCTYQRVSACEYSSGGGNDVRVKHVSAFL